MMWRQNESEVAFNFDKILAFQGNTVTEWLEDIKDAIYKDLVCEDYPKELRSDEFRRRYNSICEEVICKLVFELRKIYKELGNKNQD